MTLAIENFSSGCCLFPTAMSSSVAGTINSSGTNRLIVVCIGTGRSRADGASQNVGNPATAVSASGLTFTRVEPCDEWKYNPITIAGTGNPAFPHANLSWAIFTAPAAAQQTAKSWTCTIGEDGLFNNGYGCVFAISGFADIDNVPITSQVVVEDLTNTATRPFGQISTDAEAAILGFFGTRNSGYSFNNITGYTRDQNSASGDATTNINWCTYRGVEATAVTNKEIGEPPSSGTTNVWHGVIIGFGANGGSAVPKLKRSIAAVIQ